MSKQTQNLTYPEQFLVRRGSLESWQQYIENYKKQHKTDEYIVPSGQLIAIKNSKEEKDYKLKLGNGIDDFYSLPYLDEIPSDSYIKLDIDNITTYTKTYYQREDYKVESIELTSDDEINGKIMFIGDNGDAEEVFLDAIISVKDYESWTINIIPENEEDEINITYYEYYLTSEYLNYTYYTKGEVDKLIEDLHAIRFEIVNVLPQIGESNVIYLVKKSPSLVIDTETDRGVSLGQFKTIDSGYVYYYGIDSNNDGHVGIKIKTYPSSTSTEAFHFVVQKDFTSSQLTVGETYEISWMLKYSGGNTNIQTSFNQGNVSIKNGVQVLIGHQKYTQEYSQDFELKLGLGWLPVDNALEILQLVIRDSDGRIVYNSYEGKQSEIGDDEDNLYDEFIWIDNNYEVFGSTNINLDDFYRKNEIDAMMNMKANKLSIVSSLPVTGVDSKMYFMPKIPEGDINLSQTFDKTDDYRNITGTDWQCYTFTSSKVQVGVDSANQDYLAISVDETSWVDDWNIQLKKTINNLPNGEYTIVAPFKASTDDGNLKVNYYECPVTSVTGDVQILTGKYSTDTGSLDIHYLLGWMGVNNKLYIYPIQLYNSNGELVYPRNNKDVYDIYTWSDKKNGYEIIKKDKENYYTKSETNNLLDEKLDIDDYELIENDNYYYIDQYKANGTYPKRDKLVFTGWYTDDTCTTAYTDNTGIAYAKFVDENVFQVKCDTENSHTAIRFVSTLDRTNYQSAGFLIYGQYGTVSMKRERNATTLYTSITDFELTDFSPESHYFFTYTISGLNVNTTPNLWQLKAQFVTADGTKVYTDFISPIYKFNTEETILPSYEGDNLPLLTEISNRIKENYTKDYIDNKFDNLGDIQFNSLGVVTVSHDCNEWYIEVPQTSPTIFDRKYSKGIRYTDVINNKIIVEYDSKQTQSLYLGYGYGLDEDTLTYETGPGNEVIYYNNYCEIDITGYGSEQNPYIFITLSGVIYNPSDGSYTIADYFENPVIKYNTEGQVKKTINNDLGNIKFDTIETETIEVEVPTSMSDKVGTPNSSSYKFKGVRFDEVVGDYVEVETTGGFDSRFRGNTSIGFGYDDSQISNGTGPLVWEITGNKARINIGQFRNSYATNYPYFFISLISSLDGHEFWNVFLGDAVLNYTKIEEQEIPKIVKKSVINDYALKEELNELENEIKEKTEWELIADLNKGSSGNSELISYSDFTMPTNHNYKKIRICFYLSTNSSGVVSLDFNNKSSTYGTFYFGSVTLSGLKFYDIRVENDYMPNVYAGGPIYATATIDRTSSYNYGQRTNYYSNVGSQLDITQLKNIKLNIGSTWIGDNNKAVHVIIMGMK